MMTPIHPKPPLGVMPEYIWVYHRASYLMRAIIREEDHAATHGLPTSAVVKTWVDELTRHLIALKAAHPPRSS